MTTSQPSAPRGAQKPRLSSVPPHVSSAAVEVIELCDSVGLHLDPWQRHILTGALGERSDGKWSAFEVAQIVSRQNGKGGVLEARELGGLFLFGERLQLHSSHEFKTSREAFIRIRQLVDGSDDLRSRVKRIWDGAGNEGIELKSGARLRFVARSKGSGRGFSGDLLVYDEAMSLSPEAVGASLPALSARANPQVWYAASAGFSDSHILRRLRARAESGNDESLAYFEWSVDPTAYDRANPQDWARANPAMGIRITSEHISRELAAMDDETFDRERLGVWDDDIATEDTALPLAAWNASMDSESEPDGTVTFGVDMPPNRTHTAIGVAGDCLGKVHGEVVDYRPGQEWVVQRCQELAQRWEHTGFMLDQAGPASTLIAPLEAAGLTVFGVDSRGMAQACGELFDLISTDGFRHIGQDHLSAAVASAKRRDLTDAWAFSRKRSGDDICPLVAVTLAAHGHTIHTRQAEPSLVFI